LRKKINISIPQPCHENWEGMSPVEKGKFCSSCQKKVFDFTKASDKEIIDVLQNEDATCGRFTLSQLNRNLFTNQQKSSYWLIASATILGFLGLGNQSSYAQVKNETVQVETNNKVNDSINPKLALKIKGTVSDEYGSLPGASVIVKGTTIGTYCDLEGNFEIDAKIGDTLEFAFAGKNKVTEKINKNEFLTIKLNENIVLIGEICITKKRTFFGRQIQKVKNWFR
jgi:hypothetical protein